MCVSDYQKNSCKKNLDRNCQAYIILTLTSCGQNWYYLVLWALFWDTIHNLENTGSYYSGIDTVYICLHIYRDNLEGQM